MQSYGAATKLSDEEAIQLKDAALAFCVRVLAGGPDVTEGERAILPRMMSELANY